MTYQPYRREKNIDRAKEMLVMYQQGMSYQQIANALTLAGDKISAATVCRHILKLRKSLS